MKRDAGESGSVPVETRPTIVAFLLNSLCMGGSERKTVRVANHLSRHGHKVHLVYLNSPDTLLPEVDPSITVHCLERQSRFSLSASFALRRLIDANKIGLVFCVNLHPLVYIAVSSKLGFARMPPFIALVNKSEFPPGRAWKAQVLYRYVLNRSAQIVFGCKTQMTDWRERFRLRGSICSYVYNGVDTDRFRPPSSEDKQIQLLRTELSLGGRQFVIGCVGQLRPEKGHTDLLHAAARLTREIPSLKVLIVGSGPEEASLRKLTEELRLTDHVVFYGQVSDPGPALALMDVFVLPSIAVETFSNAALEAMAMGRAVILSDIGGAGEMIRDSLNGLIFRRGDIKQLCGAIQKLHHDAELRRDLGREARKTVQHEFSNDQMFRRYEEMALEFSIR